MANSSTITILDSIEFCKRFNFGRHSNITNFLEPAKTAANLTLQTMLGPPFAWRWNRNVINFATAATTAWAATTVYALGYIFVDPNGNSQTVTSIGSAPHQSGSSQPTWPTLLGATITDGNLTWTTGNPQDYTVATDFGWIETSSIQDTINSVSKWFVLTAKICLGLDSPQARPTFLSAQADDGAGNITFRLMPNPSAKQYNVNITVQEKAALITSLNQTWDPIPDEYSYIYQWGFLALMFLYADDPRWQTASAKFASHLIGANQGLTQTQINVFLANWQQITGAPVVEGETLNQGVQARGGI